MRKTHRKAARGQILLIIILLSTVLLTVGLSVSHITTQEIQIAKLEEESKRAFAAAEAGLDAALETAVEVDIEEILPGEAITGQATIDTSLRPTFVTPLLRQDEQYTLYLADRDFTTYYTGDVTFYLGSGTGCPAIELTIVSSTNSVTRRLIDPCSQAGSDVTTTTAGVALEGVNFTYRSSTLSFSDTKLIIMRNLFADTKVGVAGNGNLPPQGKTIISTATTQTGVTKKIKLFQSLPQFPADFFVTSF